MLLLDLYGCGDSPGELESASWSQWLHDIDRAHGWMRSTLEARTGLWALRAGALLALEALAQLPTASPLVLWQPVTSGRQHLTQFLRLKLAAQALQGGERPATTAGLMSELERGAALEIAGYRLPPAIALPMSASAFGAPPTSTVQWFEVNANAEVPPAALRIIAAWQSAGADVRSTGIAGPPFWQTQELEDCPGLLNATVTALAYQ